MSTSPARTLKGSRRLQRRHDRRRPSPQWQFLRGFLKSGDGRLDHSVEPGADREDAEPGRLGQHARCSSNMARASAPSRGRSSTGLAPDATLVTIDTNPDFTRYLKESIDDPRLVAVTGSAADVEKILADRGLG